MKKRIILATIASSLLLGACTPTKQDTATETSSVATTEQKETIKEFKNVKAGAFILGKDGVIVPEQEKNTKILDWYLDPSCPSCVALEGFMKDETLALAKEGTNVRFHPMGLLNQYTPDNYSTRAAAYILASAEVAPKVAYKYLTNIFSTDFHPILKNVTDENKKPEAVATSDEEFKALFISSGGSEDEWNRMVSIHGDMTEIVTKESVSAFQSKELNDKAPEKEGFYVPFLFINDGKVLDFTGVDDPVKFIREQLALVN